MSQRICRHGNKEENVKAAQDKRVSRCVKRLYSVYREKIKHSTQADWDRAARYNPFFMGGENMER